MTVWNPQTSKTPGTRERWGCEIIVLLLTVMSPLLQFLIHGTHKCSFSIKGPVSLTWALSLLDKYRVSLESQPTGRLLVAKRNCGKEIELWTNKGCHEIQSWFYLLIFCLLFQLHTYSELWEHEYEEKREFLCVCVVGDTIKQLHFIMEVMIIKIFIQSNKTFLYYNDCASKLSHTLLVGYRNMKKMINIVSVMIHKSKLKVESGCSFC